MRSWIDLRGARFTAWPVEMTRYWILVAAVALMANGSAHALVIATTLDTTVNPASYGPSWTQGDPGWDNVTESGSNFVYLGDSWVLSARHVGTPATFTFSTGTFGAIPEQSFVVQNPPPALVNGMQLSAETDLRLIRINGDPGLPSVTIASQSPPTAGINGSQVVFVGQGRDRAESETLWQVNTSNPQNWIWTEVDSCSGSNCYRGIKTIGGRTKRWGTNRLANPNDAAFSQAFTQILTNTTAVLSLNNRDVITLLSKFDRPGLGGSTSFETQAVTADSGGAVFFNNGGQWELVGIVNAVLNFNQQPGGAATAVYGNATTFANLSYYNQSYSGSISDIINSNPGYSIIGDITLDGQITASDVSAFQAGWGYNNGLGVGDITSWMMGDLNLDGRVDVADFLLMRQALNGTSAGGGAALAGLLGLGAVAVPEPAALLLLLLGAALLFVGARRQRRRAAF